MRAELDLITQWIPAGSHVLDLGCGDGTLLAELRDHKQVTGLGVEIDQERILSCLDKGVPVVQKNIDAGLDDFLDKSFDVVVMSQSLQQLKAPHTTLAAMLRIGHQAIVTFPNFGFWNTRRYLAFLGRMPMSKVLPYRWYDTPNIHLCTCKDFEALCHELGGRIIQNAALDTQYQAHGRMRWWPNLLGEVAVYHVDQPNSDRSL